LIVSFVVTRLLRILSPRIANASSLGKELNLLKVMVL
jgi:hypothetical protein